MKILRILFLLLLIPFVTGFDYVTNTYNVTNSVASKQYKDFTWTWSGYDDQKIVVNIPTTIIGTLSNMHMRLAAPRGPRGTVYLEMGATISTTSASYSVSRTNLPPSGRYFVEALHYAVTTTNEPTRVMAKGKVQVEASVYSATNQASWVNPLAGMVLGPPTHIITNDTQWPFLVETGGTMTGNLTMSDDTWVGVGASAGRVEFDDTTIDLVEVLSANLRVGNGAPARATAAESLYVEGPVEVDAAIYADGGLSVDVISEDPSLTRGVTIDGVVLADSGIVVGGTALIQGALDLGTVQTFADGDGTPDVSGGAYFNTHSSAETITDFDGSGIVDGQVITVFSKGATTFDDGGLLRAGSKDIVTANGDLTIWMYDGTDWVLLAFMDDSSYQGAGNAYVDGFHVWQDDTATFATDTAKRADFDTETYDPDGVHDHTSETGRVTWNGTGMCHINFSYEINATVANDDVFAYIRKNGSDWKKVSSEANGNIAGQPTSASGTVIFYNDTATDYFELWVTQGESSSKAIPHSEDENWMSGYRLPD